MKYAIYDKTADGYLTKMEFATDVPDTEFIFSSGYTKYITEAFLFDVKVAADTAIVNIESNKFMEKGRFVIHSFDDELNGQYIISEAGKPTKVVNSITVDLDGNINVGYGVMPMHWSCSTLEYAINRMNALQKAKSPKYTSWCNTFDIYKVITVTDERSCNHYQFIKVTEKGLTEYAKDEVLVVGKEITDITEPLNKRIEELEKANYELGQTATARGVLANRFQKENDDLKTKVESIKKEARHWKNLYTNADGERNALKNVIDNIYDDLHSDDMCKDLKDTYLESQVRNIIDENVAWKNKAMKAEKDLNDQKKLNKANSDTITELMRMLKEISEVIYAIKNAVHDNNTGALDCIKNRMYYSFGSDYFTRDMSDIRINILDICADEKKNITNHNLKNSEIARLTNEKERALERAEFYKRMANSVYGMFIPGRCGKQMTADVINGKKILVDKKKYDDLIECVNNISLTYEMMKLTPFSMDRPSWLSGIINRINDLTK